MSFAANPEEIILQASLPSYLYTEQPCPKTGSLQAVIPKLSLGYKNIVDISSGLSQNWSFPPKSDGQR